MKMKEIKDVYPVTIIVDRYGGCYSGGKYLAFNLEPWDLPRGVSWGGDVDCAEFWADDVLHYVIGKGDTPEESYQDLVEKMQSNEKELNNHQLDPKMTFEDFIEGSSNKLPRTMGLSIAEHLDENTYNPFFIYGPSGCGKTHLINAIGVRCREIDPQKRVVYVKARQFQREFTDSVRHNTTNDFIDFYQSLDVLIVDDIQEWMDAPKTLDTFFYISNQLKSSGKQVILASDRPPVKLKGMKKDLITRLASGLVVEIEAPNEQLSIEILRANCIQSGLDVNDEVIEYIAKNVKGSVCNLEGIVNSLKAHSTINTAINMQLAERLIKHLFN